MRKQHQSRVGEPVGGAKGNRSNAHAPRRQQAFRPCQGCLWSKAFEGFSGVVFLPWGETRSMVNVERQAGKERGLLACRDSETRRSELAPQPPISSSGSVS